MKCICYKTVQDTFEDKTMHLVEGKIYEYSLRNDVWKYVVSVDDKLFSMKESYFNRYLMDQNDFREQNIKAIFG